MHPEAPAGEALTTEAPKALGDLLAELRQKAGLSQHQLVQAAIEREPDLSGLVASAPAHWERDRRVPSPRHLLLVIRTLRIVGDDFLTLIGAASRREPHTYSIGDLLLREGRWEQKDWEEWALSFPSRSGRRGKKQRRR